MDRSRNIPHEVKEKLDIVDVINRYVKLKKVGKNWSGLCPFHNEKSPSFMVNPEIQYFKCYGCGKSGDLITFVQEVENIEFYEALKKLAEEAGISMQESRASGRLSGLYELNKEAALFFNSQLKSNQAAMKYLTQRGITKEAIEQFQIGYAPGYNKLLNTIRRQKPTKETLLQSGLFTEKNGSLRDRFINRIMFPILSPNGKYIGFTGRSMPGDDFGPKYLNTPETPIFQKRESLFGMYHSKSYIRKEEFAVLCEGSVDVITAHSIGIKNIVAPLGTSLTEQQLTIIKKHTDRVLFLFDSDTAGQQATERAFIIAAQLSMNSYAANPAPYGDLDDVIQKDPKLAKKLCKPKQDAYIYLIRNKAEEVNSNTPEGLLELKKYHAYITEKVSDQDLKNLYDKRFDKIFSTNIATDTSAYTPTAPTTTVRRKSSLKKKQPLQLGNDEIYLLVLAFRENAFTQLSKISTKYILNPKVKELLKIIKEVSPSDINGLIESGKLNEELKEFVQDLIFAQDKIPHSNPQKALNQTFQHIKLNYFEKYLTHLRKKVALAEEGGNESEAEKIHLQIEKVSDNIKAIKNR